MLVNWPGAKTAAGNARDISPATSASTTFMAGPAIPVSSIPVRSSRKFRGSIGTGLAQPKKYDPPDSTSMTIGRATVPIGSTWASGSR